MSREEARAPFDRLLVANRGEIALRVIRTCREKGIDTVAVYSRAESGALHVSLADSSCCVGEAEARDSYMNVPNIVCAALQSGARAVHPGYGFLSEDARFAEICEAHGLDFIGPSAEVLKLTGDKYRARETARSAGVRVLPASREDLSSGNSREEARRLGFPVVAKPRSGGGGHGIKFAGDERAFSDLLADASFRHKLDQGEYYLERCLERPRHIEAQALADRFGTVQVVGLRDCSIQRDRQKVIEESPPPGLSRRLQSRITKSALRVCHALGFTTAGTVEFLVRGDDSYFLELNPRVQVEHTVTEMLTGIDIVWEQIRLTAGGRLVEREGAAVDGGRQRARGLTAGGHAIQARICAVQTEKASASGALVTNMTMPGGPGVRVDTHLYPGCRVPFIYDPLLAKVIAWGATRPEAIERLLRALGEVGIDGVRTNLESLELTANSEAFREGRYDTRLLADLEGRESHEAGSPVAGAGVVRGSEASSA